jgi:hypothetical protein
MVSSPADRSPQVLISSLTTPVAVGKTFELVAESGPATANLAALFAELDADGTDHCLDGIRDTANMDLDQEPVNITGRANG